MPLSPEQAAAWLSLLKDAGPWAFGALLLLFYHKPILAALQRTARDPLIDALADQNKHFAENNKLFLALGPALEHLVRNTGATAAHAERLERLENMMGQLLSVQRGIKEELIRGGSK